MDIVKTQGNNVKILDAATGNLKCNIPMKGEVNNVQMQNGQVVVQLNDGGYSRTKVYDPKTGNLMGNY